MTCGTPAIAAGPSSNPWTADAAPQLEARGLLRHRCHGALDDGPAPREEFEAVIPFTKAAAERLGDAPHRIEAQSAVLFNCRRDGGQLCLEDLPIPRQEEVAQPELRDPLAIPTVPGVVRSAGRSFGIPLEHRDRMAVLGQHHAQPHAHDAATDDQDIRHACTPRFASPC